MGFQRVRMRCGMWIIQMFPSTIVNRTLYNLGHNQKIEKTAKIQVGKDSSGTPKNAKFCTRIQSHCAMCCKMFNGFFAINLCIPTSLVGGISNFIVGSSFIIELIQPRRGIYKSMTEKMIQ